MPAESVKPIRIDDVLPDPRDPEGEITLYKLSVWNAPRGAWENLCAPRCGRVRGWLPAERPYAKWSWGRRW